MSWKRIINLLLVLGFIFVIYHSVNRTQHGDPAQWIKEHGAVVNRRGNPDEFCIKCHTKEQGQTKENFCNGCHSKYNVKAVS